MNMSYIFLKGNQTYGGSNMAIFKQNMEELLMNVDCHFDLDLFRYA